MRATLLVCQVLLLTMAVRANVPSFLKTLVQEVEAFPELLPEEYRVATVYQVLASSFVPYGVRTNQVTSGGAGDDVTLYFPYPRDRWSQSHGRQWWIILGLHPQHGLRTVTLDTDAGGFSQELLPDTTELRFNITGIVFPGTNSTTMPVRVRTVPAPFRVRSRPRRSSPSEGRVILSGVENGPLLVRAVDFLDSSGNLRSRPTRFRFRRNYDSTAARALRLQTPGDTECRLTAWNVSTEYLGWTWVSYPDWVQLNMCTGQCPIPAVHRIYNASNHALARHTLHLRYSEEMKNHPAVHCTPVTFHTTSLLLNTEEGYSVVTSQDLSVSSCGCR